VTPDKTNSPVETAKARKLKNAAAQSAAKAMDRFAMVSMALILIDLTDQRILAANSAAGQMLGETPELLVGRLVLDFVAATDWDALIQAHADVREGRLDGYQARRTFVPNHGEPFEAEAWVRLLNGPNSGPMGTPTALVAINFDDYQRYPVSTAIFTRTEARASLMAIMDHDWVIESASSDSNVVLGIPSRELINTPFLGMVNPGDAPNLLFAVERAKSSGRAVVCRLRLRTASHEWWDTVSFVNLLCEHSPPRLGIMSVVSVEAESPLEPRASELEQSLQRIAAEIRAAEALMHVPEVLGQTTPEQLAGLTSRQLEVLGRLSRGESAAKIAEALFLSPSTVRNQLSTLYRQFGVHSQVELLSLFRIPVGSDPSDEGDGAVA
jgi:PAS domain S-box-containing protein